ncbi:MAG: low molecular weight protein-tyrosine-phosphatase [Nonlabens sp.]
MTKILMVCLGNICRSPLAEGLLKNKVNFTRFLVDSAGTSGSQRGEAPDPRSVKEANKHGIDITQQRSRALTQEDFDTFDYIYVMDDANYHDVIKRAPSEEAKAKVIKILDESFPGEGLNVPDPYYGGSMGFTNVYRMLDHATTAIAKRLEQQEA